VTIRVGRGPLLAAVLAGSGFAGLAYEVVWTRILSATLGSDMMATLGVVTGFFAGLALGALLLDGPIGRSRRPAMIYALLEVIIAAWAVASVWLLPASGRAFVALLGAQPPPLLLWAAGFVLPALVLLPATAAMGGTLIALERVMTQFRPGSRVVALVYGANTAGAMAGCLASVFALLPWFGVSRTLLSLAANNLLCALAAVMLSQVGPITRPVDGVGRRGSLLLAGTGILGIAFEVLAIRLAAQLLQNTIHSFAVLLAAYLLGTAIGSLAWQRAGLAPGRRAVGGLLSAACAASLLTAGLLRWAGPMALAAGVTSMAAELAVAAGLFLIPAAAMGALFACVSQSVRDDRGSLGWAMGVNALGAAAAPAIASLVIIPTIGALAGMVAVGLGYLLLIPRSTWRKLPLAAFAALISLWPGQPLVRVPEGGALLETREGPTATASVVRDAGGDLFLEVNGHFRMGGSSSRLSDWRQAHIPLLLHPDPHRALFLGVGTGATLAGAAALPGNEVSGVELSPEVVRMLPHFAEPGAPPLPPVSVADARRFIASASGTYDVIVADLFHPALDGTGALYTVEHFTAVHDRLAPGGLLCQWLPLYQLDDASLHAITRSFLKAFPDGTAWLAHLSLQTPMLALIGTRDGAPLDVVHLQQRLNAPGARAALEQTGLHQPLDLLGLSLGSASALAGPGPLNTDDNPFVALDAQRNVRALQAPPASLLLQVLREVDAAKPPSGDPALEAYRRARDRFLTAGAAIPAGLDQRSLMNAAIPGLLDAIRLSPAFDPAYRPLLAMASALLAPSADAEDRAAGLRLLGAIYQAAPSRPEAGDLLSRLGQLIR
jgi:spermidine synthase